MDLGVRHLPGPEVKCCPDQELLRDAGETVTPGRCSSLSARSERNPGTKWCFLGWATQWRHWESDAHKVLPHTCGCGAWGGSLIDNPVRLGQWWVMQERWVPEQAACPIAIAPQSSAADTLRRDHDLPLRRASGRTTCMPLGRLSRARHRGRPMARAPVVLGGSASVVNGATASL